MSTLWEWLRRLPARTRAALALGVGWAVFWGPQLITSKVPYERDILVTTLPLRQYFRERALSGHWPQWYPYELLGVPFAGSIVASPFHPQSLIYLLLPPAVATKWCLLLASLFGLVGAYRLARELRASRIGSVTAAYVFAFGGFAESLVSNPSFFIPLMTVPWMVAAAHRLARRDRGKDVAALAVWWALIFTGGDVQLFLEAGAVALGLMLVETRRPKALMRFGIGAVLAGLLTAAELVPALATEAESIRHGWHGDPVLASIWAFHPLRLLDFALPRFVPPTYRLEVGAALEGQPDLFAGTVYVGTAALLLAGFGLRRSRLPLYWAGIGALGIWLATGVHGGLLHVLWTVIPAFAKFRFPEKYLALTVLALIPLVALGTDAALAKPRRAIAAAFGAGAVIVLVGLVAQPEALIEQANSLASLSRPFNGTVAGILGQAWSNGLLRAGAELLALGALFYFAASSQESWPLVPALVFGSLLWANGDRVPLASTNIMDGNAPFPATLSASHDPQTPPPRVIPGVGGTREKNLPDDTLVRLIRRWTFADDAGRGHVTAWAENSSAERERALHYLHGVSPAHWGGMNVCYRVATEGRPASEDETQVSSFANPWITLLKRPCGPPAFVAASAQPVVTEDQAFDAINAGLPGGSIVWERGPAMNGGGGAVEWQSAEPERLVLDVTATKESPLVMTDVWASGWSATIDGAPTTIYPVDGAVQGVVVPAGRHTVVMEYRAPGLIAGVLLMLLGLAGIVLLPRQLDRSGSVA